jgi:hypothetical protein
VRVSGTYQTLVLDPITNGATWLRPGSTLSARLLEFGGQLNF